MFGEGKDEVGNIMNQECRIMFREIRKKRNKIEDSAAEELLQNSRRGVLAVNGDDGYPYAIPLNYFYDRDTRPVSSETTTVRLSVLSLIPRAARCLVPRSLLMLRLSESGR